MFASPSGHKLAAIIDLPADEPRATAAFTPCFTCSKDLRAVVRISRALADRGMALLRFDPTGLGQSTGDFSQTTFQSLREDARAAAAQAASLWGRCDALIGYSLGGAASLSLAAEVQEILGAVTIGAPSDTQHLAALLRRRNPGIERDGSGGVEIGGRTWEIRREFVNELDAYDLPGQLAKLHKPVLLFHAPDDETVGFDHALRLLQLIGADPHSASGPLVRPSLLALTGADHLLAAHPNDWTMIADVTVAWITRLIGSVPDRPL